MQTWPSEKYLEQAEIETAMTALKMPGRYLIWLINDDFTPMEFVVLVLKKFFRMEEEKAIQVMLQVHVLGKAVCGIFTRDIAETKAAEVNAFSRANGHPLLSTIEPDQVI